MAQLNGITTSPSPPVSKSPTNITVQMADPTKFKSMKMFVSAPKYANNQLNGGLWGGGTGFAEINCNSFEILDRLVNVPTNVVITKPSSNIYLLVNIPHEFTGTATNATNYDWDYGDGTPVTIGQNTVHTYTELGTKAIRFTAMNRNGYAYANRSISIGTLPVVSITSPTSTVKYRNKDNLSFIVNVQNYTNIKWVFGDGTTMTNATNNVKHTYNNAGTYVATVTVTNRYGSVTDSVVVNVYQRPTNLRIVSPVATGKYYARIPISFQGSASGAISYEWDFGDGMSSTGLTAQHTYAGAGTYTVKFTAFTDHVSDSVSVEINVLAQ